MNLRYNAFLGALAVAISAAGCSPTDADTSTKVKANLTADESVKAARIDVAVQKKVVTLSGAVDTSAVKERAVEVARKTDGVSEVVDRLTIKERTFGPGVGREMMGKERGMHDRQEPPKDEKRP